MLLKSITYPKGNKIETTYNGNFKATQVSVKNASGTATATTTINPTIQYNSNGTYTTSTVSPENITTTYTFDKNGITTQIQSAAVSISSPTNNTTHPTLPSSLTTNGEIATPSYDSRGNVLSVLRPDGATESFTYDAYNNLTTHTDAKGITTTYSWINTGKFLNSVSKPIGNGSNLSQAFTYQTNGLVATATNNEGVLTNFGYNAYGNVNQVQLPAASLTSTAVYDYASRLASATNALGRTTGYRYDANDNMTRETNALSQQTNYAYDDNDNLQTITNAMNGVTTLTYDAFDRLASEEFGGHTKTYSFDAIGRLAQYRKPGYGANNSRKFDYVYEAATGFLKSNGYIQNITYNGTTKNMSTIQGGTNASHTLSGFTYDNLNRLTAYTDHYGKTVGYGYDNNGNTTRIDYPNNNKVYYTYDNLNRMKTVMWNSTTVVTYNYVGSRLDNMVYGNGVKTEMTYDNIGRPTGMTTKTNNGNGSTIYSSLYTLDNVGNHTEENETQPYGSFNVPTAGTTTYSVGTDNRLNSISQTGSPTLSITHDGDGNITKKGSSTYSYDLEDNLSSYNGNGLNMTAIYDAFGNRRSVTRNGTETRYVLDINGLATVLAETNSSDVVQNYYIHGMGLAVRVKADGTMHYYHGDFRGSTVAMTNASQTITHKYQYDEFGNLLNSQEADPNPFKYAGGYGFMHESSDLSYIRARYYDPTIGRFNSEDPIWSANLYSYAGNKSVMTVDPTGLKECTKDDPLILKLDKLFSNYSQYKSKQNQFYDKWSNSLAFQRHLNTLNKKIMEWEKANGKILSEDEERSNRVVDYIDTLYDIFGYMKPVVKNVVKGTKNSALEIADKFVIAQISYNYYMYSNYLQKSNKAKDSLDSQRRKVESECDNYWYSGGGNFGGAGAGDN
jgi:RHS repeat-associated protein